MAFISFLYSYFSSFISGIFFFQVIAAAYTPISYKYKVKKNSFFHIENF